MTGRCTNYTAPVLDPTAARYVAAFTSRYAAAAGPGVRLVDEPGLQGVVPLDGQTLTQLLVTDDGALDVLAGLLPALPPGTVRVLSVASRCSDLVTGHPLWKPKAVTAMVCDDLAGLPEPVLPDTLTLHPVDHRRQEGRGGIPLVEAVATARRSIVDPSFDGDSLERYLGSLPADVRLFAAVDESGQVQATSGSRTFGEEAYVFFVNTDPRWRRRGVGLAMTATALRSARDQGARYATLDASGVAVPLYRRLGFDVAGELTQFSRPL